MAGLHDRADSIARAIEWLRRPRAALWLGAAALLLASPSLFGGLLLDDYVLELLAKPGASMPGFRPNPLLLFNFTSGRVADNRALMDTAALLPWWSDEHHLNAFFRPLASMSHLLDFRLWPDSPWLMHLHTLLWLAAMLAVGARVYRAFAGPAIDPALTMLAFALFALDGAHGMTIAWVANRNALISATFALLALLLHHSWLTRGMRAGAWLGPLCFALGLCAGETAVAVLGYLIAYGLVLDSAAVPRRVIRLAPYLVLLVAWRAAFVVLGLGSIGSGDYHDPGREPLGYAWGLVQHVPVLVASQLGLPFADLWFWGPPALHLTLWLVCGASMLLFLLIGHLLLADDKEARFWTLGMLLSACAVAASVPGERLLLAPGVGGAVFVARVIWKLRGAAARAWARPLWIALLLVHLGLKPLLLPGWAWAMHLFGTAIERVDRCIPATPEIAQRSVVVVNAPFDLLLSYIQIGREVRGETRPAHLYWLATASSELTLESLDAHSLRIRPEHGFLYSPPERHYHGDPSTLARGASIELSEITVRVRDVSADQRPATADFEFREPLRSARYLLLRYDRGRLVPFTPPPIGQSVQLPRESFFGSLLQSALD